MHILGVPKPCCQLEILLEGVEKWVMCKNSCLFSLVGFLLGLNAVPRSVIKAGYTRESVTVVTPRKSCYSRLFCGSVQRASLPYLAFSSNPSSSASSLSMGPRHLFPLLCWNFLYLARSCSLNLRVGLWLQWFETLKLFNLWGFPSYCFSDTRLFRCHAQKTWFNWGGLRNISQQSF